MDLIQGIVVNEVMLNGFVVFVGIQVNDLIILVNNKFVVFVLEMMDQVVEICLGFVILVVVMWDDKQFMFQVMVQEYLVLN